MSGMISIPEATQNWPRAEDMDSGLPTEMVIAEGCDASAESRVVKSELQTVIAATSDSAREDLRVLLQSEPRVRIIAECRDTEPGVVIGKYAPDLLVLDVGTEAARQHEFTDEELDDGRSVVVLVASDAQWAARALQLRAVDFLLRPLDKLRFHRAIERARRELCKGEYSRLAEQVIGLLHQSRAQGQPDHLVFKTKGRLIFLDLDEIDWIGAVANYVEVHVGTEVYLMRENIGRLSDRLDRERFIRIHRSVIVNVRRIKELQPCNTGEHLAVLKNGKKLPCSRGYSVELERFISKCIRSGTGSRSR